MNKNRTLQYGLVGVFALVLVVSAATLSSAHPWDGGPNYDANVHEQLVEAMESGDFEAWRSIREENGLPMRGRMMSVMDEDSFEHFVQMREANVDGDYERAAQLREQMREHHQEMHGFGRRGMGPRMGNRWQ